MNHHTRTRTDVGEDDAMQRHLRNVREEEETYHARGYGDGMGDEIESPRHDGHLPLFDSGISEQYRTRWSEIQTGFVDDPRTAVEEANRLVGDVTDRLNETFMQNRNELERQWSAGEEASTEELRLALQRYRSFFQRLLSM